MLRSEPAHSHAHGHRATFVSVSMAPSRWAFHAASITSEGAAASSPGRSTAVRMVSELLWPVHTFGPRGRSNRTGALLVVNQDAGNAQLGGTRLVLPPLTAHLNVPARSMRTLY